MFDPVSPQVSFPQNDSELLKFWTDARIFEKSLEVHKDGKPFIFYEGPPTANGMPHPGHVLTRVMKDVFLRYRSMCGYHVPRRAGWDTHGLPVEVEVEKELGIHGREEIEKYGVEEFTRKCIESVFRYTDAWQKMTQRIGFWVDLDEAYVTYHKSYVESVWWALSELFKKGLLYQGYKIVWWWPQGGTALSSGEVGQGYKEVDDPSVTVRFKVKGEENTSFLAWTTTPWTLPSNVALAVNAKETYVKLHLTGDAAAGGDEFIYVAQARQGDLLRSLKGVESTEVSSCTGADLVGKEYEPPFQYKVPEGGPAHRVVAGSFVTMGSGSGMVHLAPAFGEDDFALCKAEGLGFLQLVDPNGKFTEEVTDFAGRFCKEADRDIIRNLKQRGLLFQEEVYRHDYPFCWRAMNDPLIQYARKSWFIRTTQEIHRVIDNNQAVNWEPEHIKEGRFGSFLRTNVDWALSRERYWGTPLPIWINDETGAMEAAPSVDAILAKNPKAFDHFRAAQAKNPDLADHLMVHKPWIDDVAWTVEGEPGTYRRVPEVIDCWFDSGCMPFAQWGYPHKNQEAFKGAFPADYITEAVDQTRGWFYSLITISTLLFGEEPIPHPYKNCLVLGLLTDKKGKKMSKRDRNYADPLNLIEEHGADGVRWALFTNTVPGQGTRFDENSVVEAVRELVLKVWNVYSFLVTYARIDGWTPEAPRPAIAERSDMDQWILAELDATVREVRDSMDNYKSHLATRQISALNDALSNWYVRRSRGRFWSEGDSADKAAAFATLYEVLVDFTGLIAPFVPFVAETMYRNLVTKADPKAPESVHLAAFPQPQSARKNDLLRTDMALVRNVVSLGQRVRTERKLKVRQPLGQAIVVVDTDAERDSIARFSDAIREELNIHELTFTKEPGKYVEFQLVPNFRALGPKLGKQMPACKKALATADASALREQLEKNGSIELALPDGNVTLDSDDIEVRLTAKDDFAAASSGGLVLILDTRLTDELRAEGLAREVINRVQRARKSMDLAHEARIAITYQAEGALADAVAAHGETIARETLATALTLGSGSGTEHRDDIDGSPFAFWITP